MYKRSLSLPLDVNKSFFLFGPRGVGKTAWLKQHLNNNLYYDLLNSELYTTLAAHPERLENLIPPKFTGWIVIDEVQKLPILLNEVHRLIEAQGYRFILTGSSARSLRKKGVNLLAGRAINYYMHPLTAEELGKDFSLEQALQFGLLPATLKEPNIKRYLSSYVHNYVREEVQQEGLTRNIGDFTRFLETMSFSQGNLINITAIGRDAAVHRKVVENYITILEDLLLGYRLYPFTKKAKRHLVTHPKFYFFDAGIFNQIRPKGPLDSPNEIGGVALETLFLQHLRAAIDYQETGDQLYFWRTPAGQEVDFIVYGEKGLLAFEVKSTTKPCSADFKSLKAFKEDYPMAKLFLVYRGARREYHGDVEVIPITETLQNLSILLNLRVTASPIKSACE